VSLLEDSVVDCCPLVVFMKPKSSEFVDDVCWVGFPFAPNSTNPSRFIGTTMSFFGIRTTPRFWSSRTSIILFFLLKSMVDVGYWSIKRFVGMFKYWRFYDGL